MSVLSVPRGGRSESGRRVLSMLQPSTSSSAQAFGNFKYD